MQDLVVKVVSLEKRVLVPHRNAVQQHEEEHGLRATAAAGITFSVGRRHTVSLMIPCHRAAAARLRRQAAKTLETGHGDLGMRASPVSTKLIPLTHIVKGAHGDQGIYGCTHGIGLRDNPERLTRKWRMGSSMVSAAAGRLVGCACTQWRKYGHLSVMLYLATMPTTGFDRLPCSATLLVPEFPLTSDWPAQLTASLPASLARDSRLVVEA